MQARARLSPFLALLYTLWSETQGNVGYVDSSPWFHSSNGNTQKPKKHKRKRKKPHYNGKSKPLPKANLTMGIRCRGRWIDLSEDEDGCWLKTPYYIGIHADSLHSDAKGVHRCQTLNDVYSAAELGLLFPDEISATQFIMRMQRESQELNDEIDGVVKSRE